MFVLQGEAGIGKTALSSNLVNQVHVSGGSVCFVKCYQTEKSVPFAPISNLIRQLSRLPGFVGVSPTWIGELTRLVPDLRERFPNVPQPMAIDDSARYRLCDATVQASESVADEQPLLIAVDDIQDADEATLALLHYLGRQTSHWPVLLLAMHKTGQPQTDFERTFLETARVAGFGTSTVIGGLPQPELARLVQRVLARRGIDATDCIVERVTRSTRGNPLHTIEATMSLSVTAGPEHLGTPDASRTAEFEHSSVDRLRELSSLAQRIASVLAVAGRPLTEADLARLSMLPPGELAAALAALESAGFARRQGAAIVPAHEGYAAAIAAKLPPDQVAALHSRLARFLRRTAAGNPAARHEVAAHLELAGEFPGALKDALAAARHARSLGAITEQASSLELARRVSPSSVGPLVDLCECYLSTRDFDRASVLCDEAQGMEMTASSRDDFAFFSIAANHHLGRTSFADTRDLLMALLDRETRFGHELNAWLLLLKCADKSGAHDVARQVAKRMRRVASTHRSRVGQAYRSLSSGFVAAKYFRPRRAVSLLKTALASAQRGHDWELELTLRDGLGAALKQVGRFAESAMHISDGIALARKTLNPQAEAQGLSNLAVTEIALNQLTSAQAHLAESERIDALFPRWSYRVYRMLNQGILAWVCGDLGTAKDRLGKALEQAEALGVIPACLLSAGVLALCAAQRGDLRELRLQCARIRAMGDHLRTGLPDRGLVEAALAWDTCLNDGDTERAVRLLSTAAADLASRDIDHWLSATVELIRMREWTSGAPDTLARRELASSARAHGALRFLVWAENY
jgi:tetratricopeptide (TPR) repeat protein